VSNPKSSVISAATRCWRPLGILLLGGILLIGSAGCHMASNGENIEGARLFRQGQYYAAMDHFQQALGTDPKNADAYYNLAAAHHHMGKRASDPALLKQAENLYNQCLNLAPDHTDCHRGLAVLLVDTDRSNEAFTLLQRWALRSPHVADARVELARLYEEFHDKQTAQMHLYDAVAIDPSNFRAWKALGKIREESGDYAQALANYQRSYQLNAFQDRLGERIAGLQQRTGIGVPLQGDTRMVTAPTPRYRY